eukprot:TRINITY_DN3283_c0_g1_i1.p1 TRINITY_DN3283_c0_g1~~TRINITY_DN3283_c0_g1_i1.p1  ORF type:complete len:285 (-),score=69.10 TRINITY_DN3283_c0_g1_i1:172-1026(-)
MDDFTTRARREFENDMGDLVNNPEMSDVVFICEDDTGESRIHAHKLLLVSRNPNFEHILRDQSEIVVKEFTPDIVRKALLLLYKGDVNTVTTSDIVPLFDFATKFDIVRLKEFVGKMMAISLGDANVFELISVAHKYSARDLLADCFAFVVKKGGPIRERGFSAFTREELQLILSYDFLQLPEDVVFEFVMDYGKHLLMEAGSSVEDSPKVIAENVADLLEHVRFGCMQAGYLASKVQPLGIVEKKIILDAYRHIALRDSKRAPPPEEIPPRFRPRRKLEGGLV